MKPVDIDFGEVRSLLHQEPSEELFNTLCEVLCLTGEEEPLLPSHIRTYVLEHLSAWPEDIPRWRPRWRDRVDPKPYKFPICNAVSVLVHDTSAGGPIRGAFMGDVFQITIDIRHQFRERFVELIPIVTEHHRSFARRLVESGDFKHTERVHLVGCSFGERGLVSVQDCAHSACFRHVTHLCFDGCSFEENIAPLFQSIDPKKLRSVSFVSTYVEGAIEALSTVRGLCLHSFECIGGSLRGPMDSDVNHLSKRAFRALRSLKLVGRRFNSDAFETMMYSESLRNLKHLDLRSCMPWYIDEHADSLSSNHTFKPLQWRGLRSLKLGGNTLPPHVCAYLVRHQKDLQVLDLECNMIGDDGVYSVMKALSSDLTTLNLAGNLMGHKGLTSIVHAKHLHTLRALSLAMCALNSKQAKMIGHASYLRHVERLDLSSNPLGVRGVEELLGAKYMGNVRALNLADTDIPKEDRAAIHEEFMRSARWSSLREVNFHVPLKRPTFA